MKLKELKKKLRMNPKYLKAEQNIKWDMPFQSSRIVFFILVMAGMTQQQMAKKSGLKQSVISHAENHGCQLSLLNKMAKSVGLYLDIKVKKLKDNLPPIPTEK